jgi:hypothetical protein
MTMVMAVPAMMMVVIRMTNGNDNLGARRRYQRSEEHQSEKSKTKFLHNYSDAQWVCQVVVPRCSIISVCARQITKNKIGKATPRTPPANISANRSTPSGATINFVNIPRRWPIKS